MARVSQKRSWSNDYALFVVFLGAHKPSCLERFRTRIAEHCLDNIFDLTVVTGRITIEGSAVVVLKKLYTDRNLLLRRAAPGHKSEVTGVLRYDVYYAVFANVAGFLVLRNPFVAASQECSG